MAVWIVWLLKVIVPVDFVVSHVRSTCTGRLGSIYTDDPLWLPGESDIVRASTALG